MSNYVISGKNQYVAEERLKQIIKEARCNKDNVIDIDGEDARKFQIDAALYECNVVSLFEENQARVVIIRNPWFLKSGDKAKGKEEVREHLLDVLEQYLKDPNPACTLIFFLSGIDADTRRKEYKLLEKYHVNKFVAQPVKPWEFPAHITEVLKKNGFVLDNEARQEFEQRVGTDEFQLHNAIEKMHLYGEKKYGVNIIRQLISEDANLDIWKLGNAFLSGNAVAMMESRDQMYAKGMDVMSMIPRLASQLRKAYDIRALKDLGYDDASIAVRLRMKDSAVRMNLKGMGTLRAKGILQRMVALAEVEQAIKRGEAEPKASFEAYLLKYGVRHG